MCAVRFRADRFCYLSIGIGTGPLIGIPRTRISAVRERHVPVSNTLLGESRGFEIAQGRLGPGRVHHCMRAIGQAEVALEKICRRLNTRVAFGKPLSEQSVMLERVAEGRIAIDQARLLLLKEADTMDKSGNKAAPAEIAMIKVAAPNMPCRVLDLAIQAHSGAGVTEDFGLASAYANARLLRIVDGPDEVHRNQVAKLELRKHREAGAKRVAERAQVNAACSPDHHRRAARRNRRRHRPLARLNRASNAAPARDARLDRPDWQICTYRSRGTRTQCTG